MSALMSCDRHDSVREYEKVTYTKFWRRDSRTVAPVQRRRARNIDIKEELVYGEATYCCKQGQKKYMFVSDLLSL